MFGSSKALRQQIMEKDAHIEHLTKELELYKVLVGFSQAEAIIGIKNGEIVYKNNIAESLKKIDCILYYLFNSLPIIAQAQIFLKSIQKV